MEREHFTALAILTTHYWQENCNWPILIGKGKLSVGEYVDISRNDEYSNKDLPGFTSKVNVDETNLALFTEYKVLTNIGNFSIRLRYEDANYDYLVDDEVADDKSRHYRQWFPNASYATKIDKVELQLSYTSKVVRPHTES